MSATRAELRRRPQHARFALPVLIALVVVIAAGLAACGGEPEEESARPEPGKPQTSHAIGNVERCEDGDACEELTAECLGQRECLEEKCSESGGCNAVMLFFDEGDGLRACLDLRVEESVAAAEEPPSETTETDPVATDALETVEETVTAAEEEEGEGDEADEAVKVSVDCRGPSFRVDGLEREEIQDKLETSEDGTVVWTEESIKLKGEIEDGVFRVTESP
jgi:hypothetical protein